MSQYVVVDWHDYISTKKLWTCASLLWLTFGDHPNPCSNVDVTWRRPDVVFFLTLLCIRNNCLHFGRDPDLVLILNLDPESVSDMEVTQKRMRRFLWTFINRLIKLIFGIFMINRLIFYLINCPTSVIKAHIFFQRGKSSKSWYLRRCKNQMFNNCARKRTKTIIRLPKLLLIKVLSID